MADKMRVLIEEYQLNENAYNSIVKAISKRGSNAKRQALNFFRRLKSQLSNSKEGIKLLRKIANGKKLSSKEASFLRIQVYDLIKGGPLLALFLLPGGGVATIALVKIAKKYNFDLMPSGFN